MKLFSLIMLFCCWLLSLGSVAASAGRRGLPERVNGDGKNIKTITGGTFRPQYGMDKDQKPLRVDKFKIDAYPVTYEQFYKFVQKNPVWQKGKVSSLYADEEYLRHWKNAEPSEDKKNIPVTYISWFAAEAYCEAQGGVLPSVLQWEYVAAASETKADASGDKAFTEKLLKWYSKPSNPETLPEVGKTKPNYWGVSDMHGVIWEWNEDFNSIFVTGDNRQDKDAVKDLFCGSSSLGARDKENYAAFMRYALRNSLKARYALGNLGFRCAYEEKK